jgi:hypothetical protein
MLNQLLGAAGAGQLAQNTSLDTAAGAYATYILDNQSTVGFVANDLELSTLAGFTGATPTSRMTVAGYSGSGTQDSYGGSPNPVVCVNEIMSAVYHRNALLQGWVNLGLSFVLTPNGDGVCVINLATPATFGYGDIASYGAQIPVNPVVYPYAGQTSVGTTFLPSGETPNPAPDLGSAFAGMPITVSLATQSLIGANLTGFNNSDVTINAFTLTQQGSTTPVAARIITAAGVLAGSGVTLTSDVNSYFSQYQDCLLPLAALSPNTTYNVVFQATVKGQAVNLTWSFTTGTTQSDGTILPTS